MLIWRAKELLEGGSELLRAEIELASKRLRRVLIGSILLASGVVVAVIGAGVMLAGGAIALADELGWTWALVIIGGSLVTASGLVWLGVIASRGSGAEDEPTPHAAVDQDQETDPMEQAEEAKDRMRNAATPGNDRVDGPHGPPDLERLATSAVEFATRNPAVVGSAAFLALSLIGPGRALRLVSRGVAVAGLAASLMDKLGEERREDKKAEAKPEDPLRHRRESVANGRVRPKAERV